MNLEEACKVSERKLYFLEARQLFIYNMELDLVNNKKIKVLQQDSLV